MINGWLTYGHRGLPSGSSLARLLTKRRGAPPRVGRLLSENKILVLADAHFQAHGKWPNDKSPNGSILPQGDTWSAIGSALRIGSRGLPGGSSLPKLLKKHGRKK